MLIKYLFCSVFIYGAHVGLSLVGLAILDKIELGTLDLNMKRDLKRMAICSLLIVGPPLFIFYHVHAPQIAYAYIVLFWVVTKVAYLKITAPEIVVLGATNIVGLGMLGVIIRKMM